MTEKQMRVFENAMQLRELKEGDALTKRQVDAIEFFLGDMLSSVRALKTKPLVTITFDENGSPKVDGAYKDLVKVNLLGDTP